MFIEIMIKDDIKNNAVMLRNKIVELQAAFFEKVGVLKTTPGIKCDDFNDVDVHTIRAHLKPLAVEHLQNIVKHFKNNGAFSVTLHKTDDDFWGEIL